MSFFAHPFADAAAKCLGNNGEIAVTQVEHQLFERASDLEPRVAPGIDAVEALLVAGVLDDVARVAQGELQFVALHGENAAVGARGGLHGTREMGGVGGESEIGD